MPDIIALDETLRAMNTSNQFLLTQIVKQIENQSVILANLQTTLNQQTNALNQRTIALAQLNTKLDLILINLPKPSSPLLDLPSEAIERIEREMGQTTTTTSVPTENQRYIQPLSGIRFHNYGPGEKSAKKL
jgi:hypothetical protein